MCIIGVFVVLPSLGSIGLSFFHYEGATDHPPNFLFLQNYQRLLFHEPLFWGTLRNTFVFALSVVPLTVGLGFLFALALNARWFVGKGLVRALFFIPGVVSIVAVGFIWQWILNPSFGLLNRFLDLFHIAPQPWLGSPQWAMPCVILVAVWQGIGFAMILYLAALQNIPREYYEAASLDGAGPARQAMHITWPLAAPTTFFLVITGSIGAFQVFDLIYIMTGGGPANATNVMNNLLYRKFLDSELGYAATIAVVIFVAILGVSLLQVFIFRRAKS